MLESSHEAALNRVRAEASHEHEQMMAHVRQSIEEELSVPRINSELYVDIYIRSTGALVTQYTFVPLHLM